MYLNPKLKLNIFYKNSESGVGRLWTIIIMMLIVILMKFIFRALIPDKPQWVIEEEEKLIHNIEAAKE